MRRRVHAVVIVRRRGDRLIQTLQALKAQTRPPDTIQVFDLTGDTSSDEVFREHLGRDHTVSVTPARSAIGWSEAANLARAELPEDGWMWLLRDDTTPDREALRALMASVESAPSVVIAGPKQKMTDQKGWLREFGETITVWGERQAVVDRELDQGQYDRMSDVLAVGDAGAVMSLAVWDEIGGADPALDPLDAPLDLGIRARLAGHRVVAVPSAVVSVERGPADWRVGREVGPTTLYRLDRTAWLYRRFAYSAWWALIPLVVSALPLSALRAAGQFARKRPDLAVADLFATLAALWRVPAAIVAKLRLQQSRRTGWSAIRSLRLSPPEARRRRQLAAEARFAKAEEDQRTRRRPAFWPSGAWLTLGLGTLGLLISGPFVGARALVGGGLLPLSNNWGELWAMVRWIQPGEVGSLWGEVLIPADPAALVIALLGSLTWWSPSLAVVIFWFSAPLLAGLIAWWAAAQLIQRPIAANTFAVLWVAQPSFILALTEGRISAVMTHLALPWLVATAYTANESWQRAAQAGFATALVTAMAPVLWPAILVGWALVIVVASLRQPLRALTGTLPLVVIPSLVWWWPRLQAPGEIALAEGLGRFFADPGVALDSAGSAWWWPVVGWPIEPGAFEVFGVSVDWAAIAPWLAVVPLALALAVFATNRSDIQLGLGVLIATGWTTALASPLIVQGFIDDQQIGVWPGSAVSLLSLGVALAASATIDELAPDRWQWGRAVSLRRAGALTLSLGALASSALSISLPAGGLWAESSAVQARSDARTLPALVAAEASENPQAGTLIIHARDDGAFDVRLERGVGQVLERQSSLYRLRPLAPGAGANVLSNITASLVQPSGTNPIPLLDQLGVRFVVFEGNPEAAAARAMSQRPELVASGQTDSLVLWKVDSRALEETTPIEPDDSQRFADSLWLVTWLLWAVLALPTEPRARRTEHDGDDEQSLQRVLGEDSDD